MGMKVKFFFTAIIFLLCVAVFPAAAQPSDTIAPPSWIHGTWKYIEKPYGGEGDEEEFTITFTADNIIFDGESLSSIIEAGTVVMFTQKAQSSSYELYVHYADGFWWLETFEKPAARASSMRSTYETADGQTGEEVYTRSNS